ncbi:MAG TPA: aldehyde dehydrogenase (NADP(+)) [Thermoanaerobaculia bacterium]|nr:aldehyde dehydrogenase (NADP(+)) [Thermoanaerobaculia bacterium]
MSAVAGRTTFRAKNPATGEPLDGEFPEATAGDIDAAARSAERAFEAYAALTPARRAEFLRSIAQQVLALGERLLERAHAETALPAARLESERARTVSQILLFAALIEEGSWVGARIDRAVPDRKPQPRPDIRRMLVPLGPVAVFGASNFPLAFSVAGGDTISALAAGCPVVVKAHPAHPGTSDLVASAIRTAARETRMPEGVFSIVHGPSPEVGVTLVTHPAIRAVGFTGSLVAGRTLFDAAALRPEPIPVYAEMGSANPVFVLPGAIAERSSAIARGLAASVTLGAGQFCTNPGLVFVVESPAATAFLKEAGDVLAATSPGTMVHAGVKAAYDRDVGHVARLEGVSIGARASGEGAHPETEAPAMLLFADARAWSASPRLGDEIYGPATLAVRCASRPELLQLARSLHGHLTATIHATEKDLAEFAELVAILRRKVGRLVFNGFPTGVEVCPAMQHGGPYPATTDARSTSVGTAAIERFVRPVCYQDFPQAALPEELQDGNPRGLWRLVDGGLTRDPL